MQCSYIVFLFIKTISLFYSLFVFRISYKIIVLSYLNLAGRGLPGRGLTRLWPAGMGRVWVRNLRAWARHSRSGSGLTLNSSLRAWAGFEKLLRAWSLTANCGPVLGSNYSPRRALMCIHLHFPKLNNICHFSGHLTNLSRSSCTLCLSVTLVTFLNTFVSSANLSTLLHM